MAGERIEDIAGGELTDLGLDDLFIVLDVSDTTDDEDGTTKNIRWSSMQKSFLPSGITWSGSSSVTAVIGRMHDVEITTSHTKVTFPSSPSEGEMFGYTVTSQSTSAGSFATAPGYGIEPATGTVINGSSYTQSSSGTNQYGLWLGGEFLVWRYINSSVGWVVYQDGRRPMYYTDNIPPSAEGEYIPSGSSTGISLLNSKGTGGIVDESNDVIEIKRYNLYRSMFYSAASLTAGSILQSSVVVNGVATNVGNAASEYSDGEFTAASMLASSYSVSDEIKFSVYQDTGGSTEVKYSILFEEVI